MEIAKRKKINDAVAMYAVPAIGKAESKDELVMALTVDKSTIGSGCMRGLIRVITKRIGNENIPGYIDKSELWHVESEDGLTWRKTTPVVIKGIDGIVGNIAKDIGGIFWGLEDPDIWIDEQKIKHVYFTIAFGLDKKQGYRVYLGHAEGETLTSLVATNPVLNPIKRVNKGFKEVAISPIVADGTRINLTESNDGGYSVISAVRAAEYHAGWDFLYIAAHPKKIGYAWCAEHVSPCMLFPPQFLERHGLLVGILNGREKTKIIRKKKIYQKFRPGLFLFNPITGEIPWVSPEPLFEDPAAETITFASDFVPMSDDTGILYAHVNDSFVRAYELNKKGIIARLPV